MRNSYILTVIYIPNICENETANLKRKLRKKVFCTV